MIRMLCELQLHTTITCALITIRYYAIDFVSRIVSIKHREKYMRLSSLVRKYHL